MASSEGPDVCERCFWGSVPYWVVAVGMSCLSSFLTVGGFIIQKKAVMHMNSKSCWPRIGDIILSPQWLLGFALAVVFPLPANLVAYALAPLSLLSPLSGFTILVNYIMAPPLLGEKLQPIPDTIASICILSGTVLTTAFGDRGENGVDMDMERMLALLSNWVFVFALGCLMSVMAPSAVYMYVRREAIEQAAETRPSNPPLQQLLLPALMYAGFGCLTNVNLKAVSELFAAGKPPLFCLLIFATLVVPVASLQLNFLNRGLRLYLQVIFFPVSSAMLLVTNTLYGALYYQEYKKFADAPLDLVAFVGGVALIAIGINVFRLRKQDQQVAAQGVEPSDSAGSSKVEPKTTPDADPSLGAHVDALDVGSPDVTSFDKVIVELHDEPEGGLGARALPQSRMFPFNAICPSWELFSTRSCRRFG